MANFITIDNNKFDLNSMFQFDFNFNFDILKKTLEAFVTVQTFQNKKILELEEKIARISLKELIKEETHKRVIVNGVEKIIHIKKTPKIGNMKKKVVIQDTDGITNLSENNGHLVESSDDKNDKERSNSYEEEIINDIKNEIIMDKHIIDEVNGDHHIHTENEKFSANELDYIECDEDLNDEIKQIKAKIINIESSLPKISLKEKFDSIDKKLEIIGERLDDFNLFDLVQHSEPGTESVGTKLKIVEIIQSHENKKYKKLEIIEEKFRRLEDEMYKVKHDTFGLKTQEEGNHILINKIQESVNKLNETDEEIKRSFGDYIEKLMKELDEKHETIKPFAIGRRSSNNGSILMHVKELNEENHKEENHQEHIGQSINEHEYKYLRDLNKKMNEIERSFRVFTKEMNYDMVMDKISHLESNMNMKVNITELQELKDSFNHAFTQMNYIKDNVTQLIEDRQMQDDYNLIKKKVDTLVSTINGIKTEESSSHRFMVDSNHYVDRLFFNDFQQNLKKEMERFKDLFNKEIKTVVNDLSNEIKSCIKEKDLKLLEDYVNTKYEEIRIQTFKKFADKNETAKNMKYLDTQIKQIIDVYIKKNEKGDNWLLAKKPLGGYSCASCERYLGDLQESQEYLPWNKVSNQASDQRLYREIGNGFSRMLNMLNDNMTRDEDSPSRNSVTSLKMLPRIKSDRTKATVSFDNNTSFKETMREKDAMGGYLKTEVNNGLSAKIVKIYRKKIKVIEKNINNTVNN